MANLGLSLLLADPLTAGESLTATERAACMERDMLELLQLLDDLRRKNEKVQWRRQS
jgi:hypothetical protein